jgi:hypothetical protein
MVAQFFCKEKVRGSNPLGSTMTGERNGNQMHMVSARHHSLIKGAGERSVNGSTLVLQSSRAGSTPAASTSHCLKAQMVKERSLSKYT